MMLKKLSFFLFVSVSIFASELSLRKYPHVKKFYKEVIPIALEIATKYKLPPAALLAIAGLESGYGSGYVSQITGNILSLGAYKSDRELPRLYLPYSKSQKKMLYDPKVIAKHKEADLSFKKRAPSLKRDYRPLQYAGSTKDLAFLKYNPKERKKALYACFEDFATRWISKNSRIKIYKETRLWLDALVETEGVKILFTQKTNETFIEKIGGRPHSFNYRASWPKKVKFIMKRAGLVQLCKAIYFEKKQFDTVWSL